MQCLPYSHLKDDLAPDGIASPGMANALGPRHWRGRSFRLPVLALGFFLLKPLVDVDQHGGPGVGDLVGQLGFLFGGGFGAYDGCGHFHSAVTFSWSRAMDEQPVTIGRFLWEYLVALALIFCGMLFAQVLAHLIAPESLFVYGICLCPSVVPLALWLRYCGVTKFNYWDLSRFVLLLMVSVVVFEFVPVQVKDSPILLAAAMTLTLWVVRTFYVQIRRLCGISPTGSHPSAKH